LLEFQYMLKILALHLHTSFGPMLHGFTDAPKKCRECCGPGYSHFERTAAVHLQYSPLKRTPHFLDAPKGKNQGDSSPDWSLPSYPSPSAGGLKVVSDATQLKCAGAPSCSNHRFRRISSRTGYSTCGKLF
jgi:hypothetical protein